jgi:hypothetical protein
MSTEPEIDIVASIEGFDEPTAPVPATEPATKILQVEDRTPAATVPAVAADNLIDDETEDDDEETDEAVPSFGDWPEAARRNREAWLTEAARRICKTPEALANVLFSVGFGKGGTRGKQAVSISNNAEGTGKQVFVRPTVEGKANAASCIVEAIAGLGLSWLAYNSDTFPDYPQPEVRTEEKKQTTFLIKCHCEKCGYTVRTTARWLDQFGPPICPNLAHPGCLMVRG